MIKPLKQKIQVGATAYELQEIYGIEGQPVDGRILTQTLTSTLTLTLTLILTLTLTLTLLSP